MTQMKKLFFFRSSSSSGNNNTVSPPSTDKEVYWEKPLDGGLNNHAEKSRINHTFDSVPSLRRSISYSSGSFYDAAQSQRNLSSINDQYGSPCSNSNTQLKQSYCRSSGCHTHDSEKQSEAKCFEAINVQDAHNVEEPDRLASFHAQYEMSENSSYCSSNSNKVLDRYIDGEQKELSVSRSNGCSYGKRPPSVHYTAPASPTDSMKQKPKSRSFRETKGGKLYFSSRDLVENGFGHESPRTLARHVIERLSQSRGLPKASSQESDPGVPITIEDIYSGSLNRCSISDSDGVSRDSFTLENPDETATGCHHRENSGFKERNCLSVDNCIGLNFVKSEDINEELRKKSKEAKERAMHLSECLEQETFLQGSGFSVPALIQTIRNLMEDKVNMALEVSAALQDRISERASAQEELKVAKLDLDSRTRRLEKEKSELQSTLEKELDRRSSEWSLKLEKYQAEEHRLRGRVRELAEQNVALQREVSSVSEKEIDSRSRITFAEGKFKDLTARVEELTGEKQDLQQSLSELQQNYRAAKEDRNCIERNYEGKEKECTELHRAITRLLRTCGEQEKTISGLREGFSEELRKKTSPACTDNQWEKLQMELMRLTGVEQALRREVDSYRVEVNSLRHENMNLLQRLKSIGKEGGFLTFKLDQELWNRVRCLQGQGLSSLNESNRLCTKLLDYIKEKVCHASETKQGIDVMNGVNGQFLVESDVKLQGLRRGLDNLTRSLQVVAVVHHEKATLNSVESQTRSLQEGLGEPDQNSEDITRSELKAEILLTSILKEKLFSKELDVEQLQAELAAAVRGNDILRCELQNAMDTISCITHKMKDLEIQIIKKDGNVNQLQNDLQECTKELTIIRGILPKVSEERDLMWEEVKQYSEKNMLLNSEIKLLKKKIEALEEDVLLREGQITILKDTVGKPFDLFATLE